MNREFEIGDRVRILTTSYTIPVGATGRITTFFWQHDDITAYGVVVDEEFREKGEPEFDWCLRVGGPHKEFEREAPTDQEIQDAIESILNPNV